MSRTASAQPYEQDSKCPALRAEQQVPSPTSRTESTQPYKQYSKCLALRARNQSFNSYEYESVQPNTGRQTSKKYNIDT